MKKELALLILLFSIFWACSSLQAAIIVGRVAHIQGDLKRSIGIANERAETTVGSPAGSQDILTTGMDSKAELIFPNNLLLRLDDNTEIEIISLDEESGLFSIHSGLARAYNNHPSGTLEIQTGIGTITVPAGGVVDLLINRVSVKISSIRGGAVFRLINEESGDEQYEIISGSTTLEMSGNRVATGLYPISRRWEKWCAERENIWQERLSVRSEHLPEALQEYAYVLEPLGQWRKSSYRGHYYWTWQPRFVPAGWEPYSTGYWLDWYGGRAWVSYEPWGWVTHHHGEWFREGHTWLWTPYVNPANSPGVSTYGFSISFGKSFRPEWHPGRVPWRPSGKHLGRSQFSSEKKTYRWFKRRPRTVVVHDSTGYRRVANKKNRVIDNSRAHFFKEKIFVKRARLQDPRKSVAAPSRHIRHIKKDTRPKGLKKFNLNKRTVQHKRINRSKNFRVSDRPESGMGKNMKKQLWNRRQFPEQRRPFAFMRHRVNQ